MDSVEKTYERADGAPITDEQALKIGREIDKLVSKNGAATPEDLLDSAARKSSPIHDLFDWDDSEAARKWRIAQAGQFIRYVRVRVVSTSPSGEQKAVKVRAFSSVKDSDGERGYQPTPRCMDNENLRKQVLERALSELRAFEAKYGHLQELSGVLAAIREARQVGAA